MACVLVEMLPDSDPVYAYPDRIFGPFWSESDAWAASERIKLHRRGEWMVMDLHSPPTPPPGNG